MVINIAPHHSFVYDGAVLNVFHANKGEGLPRHNHNFAHATFCCAGSCYVRKENKEILITKDSQPLNLKEIDWHEIEAAEDGTVFINVFAEGKY
jgi:quercetin dioxygenase-like cupin family protein